MPETQETNDNHKEPDNKKKWRPRAWLWFIFYGLLVLAGLAIGSWYFEKGADRAKFWVDGLLSAAVLSIVAIQAYIYREQWHVMERQWRAGTKQIELMALSECAYVTIGENWKVDEDSWNNDVLVVHGQIHNGGRTPALNFRRKIQIAIGEGKPPPGWGRFEWDSTTDDSESIVLVSGGKVNCSTPPMKLSGQIPNDLVLGKQMVVIDGQCRYLDILGGEQVYTFGLAIDWMTSRALVRYQNYRREKTNPENPR